ncbi:MAG: NAD-dependent epimerase/dehydratase family protein [Chitinophagia bacterium]|jgi:dihydroflavonol-4-reductase
MIFVTGASGLVGSHLIKSLLSQNKQVVALYRNSIPDFEGAEKVTWVLGDILDIGSLEKAMNGADQVYHCAAIVSFAPKDRQKMLKANQEGTANVVNTCLDKKIQKLVYVSSVAALGRIRVDAAIDETMSWTPESSNSIYGQTKYLAEMEVWRGMAEGLQAAIVNPVIILGSGDWTKGSSEIFKSAYDSFPWYTNGVSGFVDVMDVVDAMQLLMDSPISGQRYIISAENVTYQSVFSLIAQAFNKRPPYRRVTPLLTAIVWRLEAIKGMLTGKSPLLTKETAATAQAVVHFDNSKLLKAFPQFKYRLIPESIKRICLELKQLHHLN